MREKMTMINREKTTREKKNEDETIKPIIFDELYVCARLLITILMFSFVCGGSKKKAPGERLLSFSPGRGEGRARREIRSE